MWSRKLACLHVDFRFTSMYGLSNKDIVHNQNQQQFNRKNRDVCCHEARTTQHQETHISNACCTSRLCAKQTNSFIHSDMRKGSPKANLRADNGVMRASGTILLGYVKCLPWHQTSAHTAFTSRTLPLALFLRFAWGHLHSHFILCS